MAFPIYKNKKFNFKEIDFVRGKSRTYEVSIASTGIALCEIKLTYRPELKAEVTTFETLPKEHCILRSAEVEVNIIPVVLEILNSYFTIESSKIDLEATRKLLESCTVFYKESMCEKI